MVKASTNPPTSTDTTDLARGSRFVRRVPSRWSERSGWRRDNKRATTTRRRAEGVRWRWPRYGAFLWLALAALVVVTALGPAPALVPTGIAAVLAVVYVVVYGPWAWKHSPRWLRANAPMTRAIAKY
ncbi:MAG: hypothetical protein ABIW84_08805, partial [Ilumatobacteraceae bacterium]